MAANIFYLVPGLEYQGEEVREGIVNMVNEEWGMEDPDDEEDVGHFEWCDEFKGAIGPNHTIGEVMVWEENMGPHAIIVPYEDHERYIAIEEDTPWRKLLGLYLGECHVLFIKARGAA